MHPFITQLQQRLPTPVWLRSSAMQQGLMFIMVSVVSLILMSSLTIAYVDYHLDEVNNNIEHNVEAFMLGTTTEINKEPIDEDDVIDVLATGFILSGILVVLCSSAIVIYMTRRNQAKIDRIETVLRAAADGELSARTMMSSQTNDLTRIGSTVDEMLSRLQSVVAAMSDISSNIAHELKTPITRLQYNLQTLSEMADAHGDKLDDDFSEQLQLSLKESNRLANIFDALLRISQIESGNRRQRFETINVVDLVHTIAEIYTDVAEDASMTLTLNTQKEPIFIQGDKELLIQQFANLVENSLRYCPQASQLTLSCHTEQDNVVITMADNGPGIDDQEKQRVFERLYRINKSRNDGGLGIGLTLVKAVTDLHQGEIKLYDCHPGLGVEIRYHC
ncbi:two-component sensor histidine kinase [Photobacterium sp. NCIMB 13483]|uniref:sensor histidine kinase n=1 Tax=Photobacterium sp. NCIMB 13483 TaxID=2022103 RepID=UPI000D17D86E|nr:HAMP domain-containing sensor histidine kinase [Photobacterium sp. NCIMB 13483]PST86666.1 two-component sensor histidine kinase [Photobacterium sp. NCIMB 13483]